MEGKPRARLFVVSGPSGAGKGTVLSKVRELRPDLGLTVSVTTREPRAGEVDGVSYHFLSEAEFRQRIAQGEFLEWADVHGHLYGTLRKDVDTLLAAGSSLVLEIDVQGALNVRESYPEAVLVFIAPPSMEELERRLRMRGSETKESMALRLADAAHEFELAKNYDVVITNDDLDRAVSELIKTIRSFEMK